MSKPKNWPDPLPYLTRPLHGESLTKAQVSALRTKPESLPVIPPSSSMLPSPVVRIQRIREPSHPANGQYGLFAAQNLAPGSFILPYLGRVHPGTASAEDSDYDLWLDQDADVAVDAAREGNEARFVNDFRGVKERANARFGAAWCERWGEVCVGFWVLGGGGGKGGRGAKTSGGAQGIKKGEEIVVSYGKGFWSERRAEAQGRA